MRNWESISNRDAVDGSAIHTEPPTAILLGRQEGRYDARAVALAYEAAVEQVFNLSLELGALRGI